MKTKAEHKWIPEAEAAALLKLAPRTLRRKIAATGHYAGHQPLPIVFSQIGRNYFYCQLSINAALTKHSNAF